MQQGKEKALARAEKGPYDHLVCVPVPKDSECNLRERALSPAIRSRSLLVESDSISIRQPSTKQLSYLVFLAMAL